MPYKDQRQSVEAKKQWYLRNKAKVMQANKAKRQSIRDWLKTFKHNKPCHDCERVFPYFVLDFDHRDPAQKTRAISQLVGTGTINSIMREIEKCDLVCANCHRMRTFRHIDVDA